MAIDRTRSGSEISNGRQLHLLRVRIQILCVWCFDFMELDGENWPPPSLVARKQKRGRAPAMERSSLRPPFRAFQQRRAATCGTLSTGSRRYRVKAEARAASIGQMRLDQSEVRAVARAEQGPPRPVHAIFLARSGRACGLRCAREYSRLHTLTIIDSLVV